MTNVPRSPILSLTVVDAGSLDDGVVRPDSQVLVVTRSETANATHPNVVSVPTQRTPKGLCTEIERTAECLGEGPSRGATYFRGGAVDNRTINGHHPTIFAVEALLARKLGQAEQLERGSCEFRAALRTRVTGVALYDNLGGVDIYEPVDMLNVVVAIREASARLPLSSSSYSVMAWTSVKSFLAGVESNDPTRISARLDPVAFCVHGVCLQAGQASLEHLLGHPMYPEYDPALHADSLYAAPHAPYLSRHLGTRENSPREG